MIQKIKKCLMLLLSKTNKEVEERIVVPIHIEIWAPAAAETTYFESF